MNTRMLLFITIMLVIIGVLCYEARPEDTQEVESSYIKEAVEFEYKNHSYIMFTTNTIGRYSKCGVVHNPNCKCQIGNK